MVDVAMKNQNGAVISNSKKSSERPKMIEKEDVSAESARAKKAKVEAPN